MSLCFFFHRVSLKGQLENHDPFPGVFAGEKVITFDLIVKLQLIHGHQVRNVLVCRVIEEQEDFSGVFIPGFTDPGHDLMEDLHRKAIEEIGEFFRQKKLLLVIIYFVYALSVQRDLSA